MADKEKDSHERIAIVNADKCKPKKCRQECKKSCPLVHQRKLCIEVTPMSSIALISEGLCTGCGICPKKCPFDAITITNIPTSLRTHISHRFSANSFKLHRLPKPKIGQVLGLLGINGIGKSTALKILCGKVKPNFGRFDNPPDWDDIVKHFRGSDFQPYFTKLLEDKLKALLKPQYIDQIPRAITQTDRSVRAVLCPKANLGNEEAMFEALELNHLLDRDIDALSGGELQRFAIAAACTQKADVYMFDEPSSYLDVKQRLRAARVIRSMSNSATYVIVVEHDLAVLDYLSDFVSVLYGEPSLYGVVTMPYSVGEGINVFLDGNLPGENVRFRKERLTFKIAEGTDDYETGKRRDFKYYDMTMDLGSFNLTINRGDFKSSQTIVLMGENGTGKTTFCRMLAGALKPTTGKNVPEMKISMKPQKLAPKFDGSVRNLCFKKIRSAFLSQQFQSDVVKPLKMDSFMDQDVKNLSGGELQRVAIVLALGMPADIYLIDEPSAYLDSEQRIMASRVIKRFIMHSRKTAFVVEHDFMMATYLADKVIVFDGKPGVSAVAHAPVSVVEGVNTFLTNLEITFRRDPNNYRPRINKMGSERDTEQKLSGKYFFLGE